MDSVITKNYKMNNTIYGLFNWNIKGIYKLSDAIQTHFDENIADTICDKLNQIPNRNIVVRTFSIE